jgi:N-acetyl-gamma-glutamyl-phosphate reductase
VVHQIFIDGQAGTTGLDLQARLAHREDFKLLTIDPTARKDPAARKALLNSADVVVLCLPDDAARESVALIENPSVRVLDASTAHRTAKGWVYGLPELSTAQSEAIAAAPRVSNPGCYATGAILALAPLRAAGLLAADAPLTINALSGYSGGGRTMIEDYEAALSQGPAPTPMPYALTLDHKHLPEIQRYGDLAEVPLFVPMVGAYYRGMLVQIPVPGALLPTGGAETLREALAAHYEHCPAVHVTGAPRLADGRFLDPEGANHAHGVELMVFGNGQDALLVARLDNLGKGAGGAAVQNLNLMLGCDPFTGLQPLGEVTP